MFSFSVKLCVRALLSNVYYYNALQIGSTNDYHRVDRARYENKKKKVSCQSSEQIVQAFFINLSIYFQESINLRYFLNDNGKKAR